MYCDVTNSDKYLLIFNHYLPKKVSALSHLIHSKVQVAFTVIMQHSSLSPEAPPSNQLSLYQNTLRINHEAQHPSTTITSDNPTAYADPNQMDILSPIIREDITGKLVPHNAPHWDTWGDIIHRETYGPFKISVKKLKLHRIARDHTMEAISALADAIEDNDQRRVYPILAEFHVDVSLQNPMTGLDYPLVKNEQLPMALLATYPIIGYILHGSKRAQAANHLVDEVIYVKFVKSGMCIA